MSAPKISLDEVRKVARLARLKLSDEQLLQAQHDLNNILVHAQDIAGLDLAHVPPTAHAAELSSVQRPDVLVPSLDHAEALSQAPDAEGGGFAVAKVMEAEA